MIYDLLMASFLSVFILIMGFMSIKTLSPLLFCSQLIDKIVSGSLQKASITLVGMYLPSIWIIRQVIFLFF